MNKTGFISILLSALVVLCPFKCIFGGCLDNGNCDKSAACAGCCDHGSSHGDDDDEHSSPTLPIEGNCGDCFCHGALPVNTVSDDLAVTELVSFLTFWEKLETVRLVSNPGQVQRNPSLLPIEASAQEVRASLCCWVI